MYIFVIYNLQNALSKLQARSAHVAEENAKLYDRMRESILKEPVFSTDDENGNGVSEEEPSSDIDVGQKWDSMKTLHKKERLMKTKTELQAEVIISNLSQKYTLLFS